MSFRFQFISPLLAILILCMNVSKLVLKSVEFNVFSVGSANGLRPLGAKMFACWWVFSFRLECFTWKGVKLCAFASFDLKDGDWEGKLGSVLIELFMLELKPDSNSSLLFKIDLYKRLKEAFKSSKIGLVSTNDGLSCDTRWCCSWSFWEKKRQ